LLQHRCLALTTLVLASLLAAQSAPAQGVDTHENAVGSASGNTAAPFTAGLSDDPSTLRQQTPAQSPPAPAPSSGLLSSEEQLQQQERQRVFGVMAAFDTTLNRDALPMTPSQKFRLFFKSQTDPWPFVLAGYVAGYDQATNSSPEYGQGMEGYAKRYGAAWGDAFIGNFFGNAVLPSLWHEDPRYFQMGTGPVARRALWAATSTVWCRRDNGSWGPNYSNLVGNLIGSAIANVYYPASERTAADTITRSLTVSAEGIVGSEVIEFWPDIVRHYQKNHAEKVARKAEQEDARAAVSSPHLP